MILFMSEVENTLPLATHLIEAFSRFSGLKINWTKSVLFPLYSLPSSSLDTELPIVSEFKYLGIHITKDAASFHSLNIQPLLNYSADKFRVWSGLPLSVPGRINLIKLIILPKWLYVLEHAPFLVPKKIFQRFRSLLSPLIWGNNRRKLSIDVLCRPRDEVGMSLPDLYLYYLSGQLRQLKSWISSDGTLARAEKQLAVFLDIPSLWPVLEQPKLFGRLLLPVHKLAVQVWEDGKKLHFHIGLTTEVPLWDNPMFPSLRTGIDGRFWENHGIGVLGDLYSSNVFNSFEQLKERHDLPRTSFFKYLQVRHAMSTHFGNTVVSISDYPLIGVIRSQGPKGFISALYTHLLNTKMHGAPLLVLSKWETLMPGIINEDINDILESPVLVSPSINNRFIQLCIVHQSYLSPMRLHRIGKLTHSKCHRCNAEGANFWHLIWECPYIQTFWSGIVSFINTLTQPSVALTRQVCLFGILDEEVYPHHCRIFLRETLQGVQNY
ncbi:uncharacterized protein LOC122946001 isoform X1 [Bufo gargarizans]|uniref:uncharacterized protein LOC122946001 isoform X1 n=1 Tax=Bufo gargarizans TaxID=30331 RepID=UPI001CF5C160|nr:uncharacterized protein LOC122946001 isoform X1 [Bufo gargarizans]XP_044161201.1 uncharacterized protein LOC122946001 isoform X1 [Bufo gargarizans]